MTPALFSDAALQKQAERALAAIPPGKSGALVAGVTMRDGQVMAETRFAVRVAEGWSIVASASAPLTGERAELSAGIAVWGVW